MGNFLAGFLLPQLLLMAALSNWSLICLVDLIAFLLIQYTAPKIGFRFRRQYLLLWPVIVIFSLLVFLSQALYLVVWAVKGYKQSVGEAWWMELIGFMIIQSWKSPTVIYFLAVQLLVRIRARADFILLFNHVQHPFSQLCSSKAAVMSCFHYGLMIVGSCDLRIFLDCSFAFWTGDEIIELCSLLECLSISHFDLYNNSLSHMIKSDVKFLSQSLCWEHKCFVFYAS
ncbi:hypothetical protein V6N12_022733 [Hibiscus sabdariffa]|uniref:Piezo non-specific cation channel R-Ras-binding domain-containing protein n=1 Tax=Hibiscus sabdariffa TaxID=183260 RepID=A0ABR2FVX7_9ROSI